MPWTTSATVSDGWSRVDVAMATRTKRQTLDLHMAILRGEV